MADLVVFNGVSYVIPVVDDTDWGQNVTDFLVAIPTGCLQNTGGTFTLTADVNFGASFGLISSYYTSRTANVASAGAVRLANADLVEWRNFANGGNNTLGVNASDQLVYNGSVLEFDALTDSHIFVGDASNSAMDVAMSGDIGISNAGVTAIQSGVIVNADVNASAAIAYTKLDLTGSITNSDIYSNAGITYGKLSLTDSIINADVNSSAAIVYSKLDLTSGIVNADVNASAAIVYSKLALSNSIVNADINASAAIVYSKLNLTGSVNLASDVTGTLVVGNGGTGAASFTAYAVLCGGTTSTDPIQPVASVGSSGFVLTSNGAGLLPTFQASTGTGTVNSGTTPLLAYYKTSTTAVSNVDADASMGSHKITSLASGSASTDAAAFGQVTPLFVYRRPALKFSSSTVVTLETGLDGTSGDAVIMFPDGNVRTETSSTRYNATTSQNAVFTNATLGNNQGGIRSGSVATNTWYACYAVKVTTFAANWVMVMDTTLPLQANYSTINTNFNANGWVYLGMVRIGDQGSTSTGVLDFTMAGNMTRFNNVITGGNSARAGVGILMATTASATSLTYSTATGTAGAVIPDQLYLIMYTPSASGGATHSIDISASSSNRFFFGGDALGTYVNSMPPIPIGNGLKIANSGGINGQMDIQLSGFVDSVLGVGSNPLL